MEAHLNKTHGLRNDLLVVLPRSEVEDTLLHIANRDRFMRLPGLLRHVAKQDPDERQQVNECKIPVEDHLKQLSDAEHDLLDANGRPTRPLIVIGSRNVGNNHGFITWQRYENPKLFYVRGDPLSYPAYSCLVRHRDGWLAVRALRFDKDRVLESDTDVTEEV